MPLNQDESLKMLTTYVNLTIIVINRPIAPGEVPIVLLSSKEECLPSDIENGLLAEKIEVIIQADREVPSGYVKDVMRAVNEVEGIKMKIGIKEKN